MEPLQQATPVLPVLTYKCLRRSDPWDSVRTLRASSNFPATLGIVKGVIERDLKISVVRMAGCICDIEIIRTTYELSLQGYTFHQTDSEGVMVTEGGGEK